ncbi:MAG TPA: 50S ribosomal protein L1 [bacterium]|nr:50S ribosomal protein L1 [bacterium]HPP30128.1 50S ribosomal protein L1 [bacterium]
MKERSKKYNEMLKEKKEERLYEIDEAVDKLKSMSGKRKFDETVDMAIHLGIDVKKLQQPVRGSIVLPHGSGKAVRILVFATGEDVEKAKAAGADYVGGEELAEKIKNGFLDFDSVVATPEMMKVVSPLGKILGPRGLMPNPKSGTVTKDIKGIITELKKGRIEFRMDKDGNLHIPVGKSSFDKEGLIENIKAALKAVVSARPSTVKGNYIRNISLSLTMSPSLKIDTGKILKEIEVI